MLGMRQAISAFYQKELQCGDGSVAYVLERSPDVYLLTVHVKDLAMLRLEFEGSNLTRRVGNPNIHMVLEYSARHLALIEWAAALKLFNYACIGFALFIPWGIASDIGSPAMLVSAATVLATKLLLAGAALALIETLNAKIRIFRAPEFLALAFMLAVLGLLVRLLVQG